MRLFSEDFLHRYAAVRLETTRSLSVVYVPQQTNVDRNSKDGLAVAKPVPRTRTASANQHVSQLAPQPPSSTGTGLSRLKIGSSTGNSLPSKSTRPARVAHAPKSSHGAPSASAPPPAAPRVQQGEWAGAYDDDRAVTADLQVVRDDGAAPTVGLGVGAAGTDDWIADQMAVDQQAQQTVNSHKRTHDVELSDDDEADSEAQSAFNGRRAPHHDDKVRILDAGDVVDPEDWIATLCEEDEAEESERFLEEVKQEFQEQIDWWDISMVAEYSDEIFEYMAELEVRPLSTLFFSTI